MMKEKTKKSTKKNICEKDCVSCQDDTTITQTNQDLRSAVLAVSIFANAFMLTGWLMLQATTQYDLAVASLLFR